MIKNIGATFGYSGGFSTLSVGTAATIRGVTAAQSGLTHYGQTGESGWEVAGKGVFAMETGMVESGQKIATGNAGWHDYAGLALLLSPVHKATEESKAKPIEEPAKDGETSKADDAETNKADEEAAPKTENVEGEAPKKEGDGEAFEEGVSTKAKGDIGEAKVVENLKAQGYTDVVQVQNNSGHGVDVIARNPLTGEVKCVEVKANTSRLSEAQQRGGEEFVNDRLQRAVDGNGHYKIPPNSEQMKIDAQKAQEWIQDSPKTDYEVHRVPVDNTTGVAGDPVVSPWDPKP